MIESTLPSSVPLGGSARSNLTVVLAVFLPNSNLLNLLDATAATFYPNNIAT